MSRSRSRSRDREPRSRRHDDGGRLAAARRSLADALPQLGGMARAAVRQWGLDESRLLAWAAARRPPGIGVADVNLYRQENPDEDLSGRDMNGAFTRYLLTHCRMSSSASTPSRPPARHEGSSATHHARLARDVKQTPQTKTGPAEFDKAAATDDATAAFAPTRAANN